MTQTDIGELKEGELEQEMFRDLSPHLLKKQNLFLRILQYGTSDAV